MYDHQTGAIVLTSEVPHVSSAQELLVPEPDDFQLRVFNYNPQDKEVSFEAHPGYIPYLAGHPALPLVFNGGDNMMVKSWDWDKS